MARTQAADYDERKDAILSHAATLFSEQGFLGTSVMDIARACGASKSLMYHYYPSKEDVLFGVMESHVDVLLEDVESVLQLDLPASAALRTLLHRFMEHYVGAAARQRVLLNELDSLPSERRRQIVVKQRKIVDSVQHLLVRAQPEKLGDPVKARAQTMLLFGMINWTTNWFDPAGKLSPSQIADMAFEMAMPGLTEQAKR